MQATRLKLFQDMPTFGGIREDIIEHLLQLSPLVNRARGEEFFREDDEADSMFVLERGRVSVLKAWQGQQFCLAELNTGDCFGEIAVMDLGRRACTVTALEACVAIEISTSALYSIYKKDLEQFTIIQMNLGREIGRRLRAADQRIFEIQRGRERVLVDGDTLFR